MCSSSSCVLQSAFGFYCFISDCSSRPGAFSGCLVVINVLLGSRSSKYSLIFSPNMWKTKVCVQIGCKSRKLKRIYCSCPSTKGHLVKSYHCFPSVFFSLVSEKAVILGRLHVSTDYIFISILTVFREFEYNLVCVLVIKTHQRLMPLQWCSKEPGHSGWWKNPHRREEGISKAKNISQHNYTSIFRNQRYIEAIYNYAFYVCVYLCRQTQIYNMYVCIYIHLYVHTRIYAIITYALYL